MLLVTPLPVSSDIRSLATLRYHDIADCYFSDLSAHTGYGLCHCLLSLSPIVSGRLTRDRDVG